MRDGEEEDAPDVWLGAVDAGFDDDECVADVRWLRQEGSVGGLLANDVGGELQLRAGRRTVAACMHQGRRCRLRANVRL